jgi:serine/threonine protein phosphatase PrpC
MINQDVFLKKSDHHKVCQDYIISGEDPIPYIVLSDGCSSSKNTDVGSRLLAHSFKSLITGNDDYFINLFVAGSNQIKTIYEIVGTYAYKNLPNTVKGLMLDVECLDSTCIISFVLDNKVYTYVYGDGIIIIRDKDGNITYRVISFPSSAPFYLSYYGNTNRIDGYINTYGTEKELITNSSGNTTIETYMFDHPITFCDELNIGDTFMISSDGLSSFENRKLKERCSLDYILSEMLKFKRFNGTFIECRVHWFLNNLPKEIFHTDDLSVGGFHRFGD